MWFWPFKKKSQEEASSAVAAAAHAVAIDDNGNVLDDIGRDLEIFRDDREDLEYASVLTRALDDRIEDPETDPDDLANLVDMQAQVAAYVQS